MKNKEKRPRQEICHSSSFAGFQGDTAEAFRLARLIALLMRVHPAKAVHPDTLLQVKLTDAGGRSFALHMRGRLIGLVERPETYGRAANTIIVTSCLTWAELCVGMISVSRAIQGGLLMIERGTAAEIESFFDSLHKLRGSDLVYPPVEYVSASDKRLMRDEMLS